MSETNGLAEQPRKIASYEEFEWAYRAMVLSNPHLDSPFCSLQGAGPFAVRVGGRARVQVQAGLGFTVWDFVAAADTWEDVLGVIAAQINEVLKAAALAASERNKQTIVRPPILAGGNGERLLKRMTEARGYRPCG